ncbi:MAG: SEC-C domain-containing protein [Campylobacteraceae bacterium]|nr:SEC-C domain-containing protein [Campylobacteraceae bacterium]
MISVIVGDDEISSSLMSEARDAKIHMFTKNFSECIFNELDTVSDFIHYLEEKESLSSSIIIESINAEKELLAQYILNDKSFNNFRNANMLILLNDLWEGLNSRPEYISKKKEDGVSYIIDDMIEKAHTAHIGQKEKYEEIARQFARLNRFDRRVLGQAFLEAIQGKVRRRAMDYKNISYYFIYSDDEDREYVCRELALSCYILRNKFNKNKKVIGVSTQKTIGKGRSYEFCLLEIDKLDEYEIENIKKMQNDLGYFKNSIFSKQHTDEYPVVSQKIKRNEPCPCGSGKKYKKCCLDK